MLLFFFSNTQESHISLYVKKKEKIKNPYNHTPRHLEVQSKHPITTMTLKWHTGKEVVNALASPGSSDGSQH